MKEIKVFNKKYKKLEDEIKKINDIINGHEEYGFNHKGGWYYNHIKGLNHFAEEHKKLKAIVNELVDYVYSQEKK